MPLGIISSASGIASAWRMRNSSAAASRRIKNGSSMYFSFIVSALSIVGAPFASHSIHLSIAKGIVEENICYNWGAFNDGVFVHEILLPPVMMNERCGLYVCFILS